MSDEVQQLSILPHDDSPAELIPVEEQIGVQRRAVFQTRGALWRRFEDVSQTDYAYWDKLRRGMARGLELSGLFIKPLGSKITSWTLGRPPFWSTRNERITSDLNGWYRRNHSKVMRAYNESLDLGDCYLVFNGDSSLTVVSPDKVTPIVADDNYQNWIGWRVTIDVPDPFHPGEFLTYEDSYTATMREHTVRRQGGAIIEAQSGKFPNPLGRVPVIHIANLRGADERFGRPEGEGLLNALIRYGDVFDAALQGNIRQGRPTPVISELGTAAQMESFWALYGETREITNENGVQETVTVIPFDPDILLTLGGNAKFKYEAPGSFSVDTQNLLGLLFYLVLQYTEIPEFVWGNAIGSSKASADSQLEPFLKFIDKKRGEAMEWVMQLAELWVAWASIYNRRARNLTPQALWRPMTSGDGRLTLDSVIWSWSKGLMNDRMAAWLLPINLDNPDEIVADGKKAADERQKAADAQTPASVPAPNATPVPASGGGAQGQFKKQEAPLQPTERQMPSDLSDNQIAEFAVMLKQALGKESAQQTDAVVATNGHAEMAT